MSNFFSFLFSSSSITTTPPPRPCPVPIATTELLRPPKIVPSNPNDPWAPSRLDYTESCPPEFTAHIGKYCVPVSIPADYMMDPMNPLCAIPNPVAVISTYPPLSTAYPRLLS